MLNFSQRTGQAAHVKPCFHEVLGPTRDIARSTVIVVFLGILVPQTFWSYYALWHLLGRMS